MVKPVSTSIVYLNNLSESDFIDLLGSLYEGQTWVGRQALSFRPFSSVDNLLSSLEKVVRSGSIEQQLSLFKSHPDLGGKTDPASHSNSEQQSAGLTNLSASEQNLFLEKNKAYREKFSFPFIIFAREHSKKTIFLELDRRFLLSSREELKNALEEIIKIHRLRVTDFIR